MRAQYVIDHIKASYPCSLNSVGRWCVEQGLEDGFSEAIAKLQADKEITLDIETDWQERLVVIVNPT